MIEVTIAHTSFSEYATLLNTILMLAFRLYLQRPAYTQFLREFSPYFFTGGDFRSQAQYASLSALKRGDLLQIFCRPINGKMFHYTILLRHIDYTFAIT